MGSVLRSLFRLIALLFFAGNTLLLILIIISGATNSSSVDGFYWVQGDTSGIPNAPDFTRWTFWGACSLQDGSTHCGGNLSPAYPISPVDNFGTTTNVPSKFISNRDSLYYLTRFSFAFFWIALAFIGISFLLYVGTWCSYGFSQVVWILASVGCLFNVTAVVLQTAASVMARNAFSDADLSTHLGSDLFGIAWASVALCLINMIATFLEYLRKFKVNIIRGHEKEFQNIEEPRPTGSKNWFFSSKNESYPADEPVGGNADPYAQNNANTTAAAVPQENQHKGINFFTVRKTQKVTREEDSV